jgi:hypothetical protein
MNDVLIYAYIVNDPIMLIDISGPSYIYHFCGKSFNIYVQKSILYNDMFWLLLLFMEEMLDYVRKVYQLLIGVTDSWVKGVGDRGDDVIL